MAKPADVPVFGQRIHREAGRMIRLVSDILQLSQLDGMQQAQGGAPPERTPLDLGVLARDVSATMTMNARKAYVSLLCEDAPAPVLGSRDMLTELITNLCDNAIRYNPPRRACGAAHRHRPQRRFLVRGGGQRHRHPAGRAGPRVRAVLPRGQKPQQGHTAAPAWAWRSSSTSPRCTARTSTCAPSSAPAPPSA